MKETMALPRGVELTAKILSFLAADDDRLDHFFSTTGHDMETVRGEAQSPAFLEALIDYILGEDARVIAFAEYLDTRPELVAGLKSLGQESAPMSKPPSRQPSGTRHAAEAVFKSATTKPADPNEPPKAITLSPVRELVTMTGRGRLSSSRTAASRA